MVYSESFTNFTFMCESVVLFDGVCNLCSGSVQFVLENEKDNKLFFASLQSDFGQEILKKNKLSTATFDSIIFLEGEKIYSESDAALKIAKHLKFPYSLLSFLSIIPKFIRNAVYKWVARNRYRWFGKTEACWLPTPDFKKRFIA